MSTVTTNLQRQVSGDNAGATYAIALWHWLQETNDALAIEARDAVEVAKRTCPRGGGAASLGAVLASKLQPVLGRQVCAGVSWTKFARLVAPHAFGR